MPTDLNRLRVSLTKHGAHKVAYLVERFDKDDILNHLQGDYKSINIDDAQARKILSASDDGTAPELWNKLKPYGEQDIFDIVFIANIFSHVDLINTMIAGIEDNCVIKRGKIIDGKAYTNFAHSIDQFGYSIEHTPDFISFDISRMFYKYYLPQFVHEILHIKLSEAGWDKTYTLIEECQRLDLYKVFGLSSDDFKTWLEGDFEIDEVKIAKIKAKRNFKKGIKFKKGHNTKFEGDIKRNLSDKKQTATLLHNHIQNKVFEILSNTFPDDEIGTEVPTNTGSIDIVRRRRNNLTFYEIKTANNVKSSIREALSQLLEYAYWNKIEGIEELIIVAPNKPTDEAIRYIEMLRNEFNIPLYYQQFSLKEDRLSAQV